MPIYSANRVGTVEKIDESAKSEVVNEAKSYPEILMDIQKNDMSIFEAIIVSDIKKLSSIKEGTLLESEMAILEAEEKKSFVEWVKNIAAALWKKLSELIDAACIKLAQISVKFKNEQVARFEKDIKDSGKSVADLINMLKDEEKVLVVFNNAAVPAIDSFDAVLNKYKNNENLKAAIVQVEILKKNLNTTDHVVDLKTYNKATINSAKSTMDVNPNVVNTVISDLKGKNGDIIKLKEEKKNAKKNADSIADAAKQEENANIANINTILTAYQGALVARTNVCIDIVKFNIQERMRLIGNLARKATTNKEKVIPEAADMADIDGIIEGTFCINPYIYYSEEVVNEAKAICENAETEAEAIFCAQNK